MSVEKASSLEYIDLLHIAGHSLTNLVALIMYLLLASG
jgi:hypothetical protein